MTSVQPTTRRSAQEAQQARRDAIRPLFDHMRAERWQPARVARMIGVSKQLMSYYEQGRIRPPAWAVDRICTITGFPREQLPADIARDEHEPRKRATQSTTGADPPGGTNP